jgi:hypothetical protein
MIVTLIWTLADASVPPVYTTSQLVEGNLCVLHWESSVMVRYSLPLMKGDRLNLSSHLKCRQEVTH